MRVTLRGINMPYFAREAVVYVAGTQVCTELRVEEAGSALSCVMPPCVQCTGVPLQLHWRPSPAAPGAPPPPPSNVVTFTYASECYVGAAPLLPPRFSAAENCTICQQAVALAVASVGDVTAHAGIRDALRWVCASQAMKEWGPVAVPRCRTDLSAGCTILYHAVGSDLADAMWNAWDAGVLYGNLPDLACAAVGKCKPRSPAV